MTARQPIDLTGLGAPMGQDDMSLEPMAEAHRQALKAACAQDLEIWSLYATSYDPDHFDSAFDLIRSRPSWRCFSIFLGGELAGMGCYLGIDPDRGVLEIGNTYYVPRLRGTGLNRRVKDLMLARAFGCGVRRVEFRVDSRNGRSQAAMAKIGAVAKAWLRQDRITWTGHVRDTVLSPSRRRMECEWDLTISSSRSPTWIDPAGLSRSSFTKYPMAGGECLWRSDRTGKQGR